MTTLQEAASTIGCADGCPTSTLVLNVVRQRDYNIKVTTEGDPICTLGTAYNEPLTISRKVTCLHCSFTEDWDEFMERVRASMSRDWIVRYEETRVFTEVVTASSREEAEEAAMAIMEQAMSEDWVSVDTNVTVKEVTK
jgi:hypothetical protein